MLVVEDFNKQKAGKSSTFATQSSNFAPKNLQKVSAITYLYIGKRRYEDEEALDNPDDGNDIDCRHRA